MMTNKNMYRFIKEQFNVNDIDFNYSDSDTNVNIFNKNSVNPDIIYHYILKNEHVNKDEI